MSDLIEQLGGYAAAKEVFEQVKARDHKYAQNFERPALDRALLEYRRANNIFEVGDMAIKTHPKNTILWPVLGVYKNGGVWLDYKGFCWKPPRVRHATDAEIKAGHRLPQLEVLDDIDIPPNTIILGDK